MNNKPTVILTPESQIRTPVRLLNSMLRDLLDSRELSRRLFVRDISAQYRQSLLGILWAFVPPIVTALIFIVLQKSNIVNFGQTVIPYPVYVLTGTILWQVFVDSLNSPLKSVTASKAMLVRINFPREALIIAGIYVVLFNTLIKAVVLIGLFLIFRVPLTWGFVAATVPVFMLVLLGVGIGLLLVPIGVLYTDVNAALPTLTQIWFFLTPVVYAPPESYPLSVIIALNPVSPLLIAARDLATTGELTNIGAFVLASALSVILVILGWVIYRISLPIVVERMGA